MDESVEHEESKWCNLPTDLLAEISQHLDHPNDLGAVRAICKSWRSYFRSLEQRTSLVFPLQVPGLDPCDPPFLLVESPYFLLSPLTRNKEKTGTNLQVNPWLIRVQETKPNTWKLLNPFSDFDNLFDSNPPVSAQIDVLLDYSVRELALSYVLIGKCQKEVMKVVALSDVEGFHEFTILALHGQWELAIWKLGDKKWTKVTPSIVGTKDYEFTDIASHNGKFYALENLSGRVYVMDGTFSSTMIFSSVINGPPKPDIYLSDDEIYALVDYYLVEYKGSLCYVVYYCFEWTTMHILKEELEPQKRHISSSFSWEEVKSASEEVMFLLRSGASFSVSAKELGLRGSIIHSNYPHCNQALINEIHPNQLHRNFVKGIEALDSIRYPHYKNCFRLDVISGDTLDGRNYIYRSEIDDDDESLSEHDDYSSIFFPPPPWLKWSCPDRGDAEVVLKCLRDYIGTQKLHRWT